MNTTGHGYRPSGTLGGKGPGAEHFRATLRGIHVDDAGRVFAVGDRSVKVWSAEGELIRSWSTSKPAISITADGDDRVLVGQSGQLEVFDARGRLRATWRDEKRLGLVTAITASEGRIFAADARARKIRRLDRDGRIELSIGRSGPRGFKVPGGFLDFGVDSAGTLHAANPGKHRIEHYSPDGELLGHFGRFGMRDPGDFTGCCNPIHVAVASASTGPVRGAGEKAARHVRIAVTEKAPPRAKIYDAEGHLLAWVGGEIFHPDCRLLDVALGATGRLWVADSVRLQIRILDPVPGRSETGEPGKRRAPGQEGNHDG